jgi:hypothetical protein
MNDDPRTKYPQPPFKPQPQPWPGLNGVAPGPIWTPLQISGGATEQKYQHFGSTTSLGRPGQP